MRNLDIDQTRETGSRVLTKKKNHHARQQVASCKNEHRLIVADILAQDHPRSQLAQRQLYDFVIPARLRYTSHIEQGAHLMPI